jgi:hypothetical protein
MARMAVLKPIMWNDKGYKHPAGCQSNKGYPDDFGYGHEEWNNNPDWLWDGWKVFHTESTRRLEEAAENGELGMVMIASHGRKVYAMGVATNVYPNEKGDEMVRIATTVHKEDDWREVWDLPAVQKCFADEDAFLKHWRTDYWWIRWRCLPQNYFWFPQPIELDPERVVGKNRFAMYFGRFTETSREVLLDIVDKVLPRDCVAIREWLSSGDFTKPPDSTTAAQKSGLKIVQRIRRGSNAPSDRRFQYWVEGDRTVEPLHDLLQKQYVQHLKDQGVSPEENKDYIDVQYLATGARTFCEIKPTDNVATRFAIRAAIGQLFEHRYRQKVLTARLVIVLGSKPDACEVGFVQSLGIELTYYDTKTGAFISF